MKKKYSRILWLVLFPALATGQTNPAPQSLPYSEDFSALVDSSTAFPAGWQGWNLASGASTNFRITAPIGDIVLKANSSAATTSGGVHNFDGKIGFLQTGSVDPSLCLSINTGGKINIAVAYNVMTIRNPYGLSTYTRINEITLQYRVDTTGNFTNLSGIEYQNNTTTQNSGTTGQNIQTKNITLPVECEGKTIVQLRWAARDVSGSGSRPSFAVDDIVITAECAFAINNITVEDVACNGDAVGSATVAVQPIPKTHLISVNDFLFTPDSVNAVVGDTIYWIWAGGSHTTTSTVIPPGAVPWDVPITGVSDFLKYVVTQAGTYDYKCTPHEGMGMTGSINVSSPFYTYQWNTSPVQTMAVATGIAAGTYTITVSNQGGCSVDSSVAINEPPVLTADIITTDASCNSGSDGAVDLTPSGGTPPYTYSWSNAATTEDISGLSAGTYSVLVTDSKGCTVSANDTVHEPAPIAASISIAVSPSSTICSGTSATYSAAPTNGGASPSYQWKLNGSNAGTNSASYTNAIPADGDVVVCEMISSLSCATGSPATSNSITMTVNTTLTPSVNITASANTICSGTSVTFTAAQVNGGSSPFYQWKLNGNNAGTNSNVYTNASLSNGDTITCEMTSNETCLSANPVTSNSIIMNVSAVVAAGVNISANNNPICTGDDVTFTALSTNGGANPAYQWTLNGINVGTNSAVYTNSSLINGDSVACEMTSDLSCVSGSPASSNTITMTVISSAAAGISIAVSPSSTICSGTSATYSVAPINGGSSPSYQWKLNGSNAGTNSASYTNAIPADGDVVVCEMISSLSCATGSPAASNTITATVNPLPVVNAGYDVTICNGQSAALNATSNPSGAIFSWLPPDGLSDPAIYNPVASPTVTTSYTVAVTDINNCSNTDTLNISVLTAPTVTISPSIDTICPGGNTLLTVSGGNSYSWSTGETTSVITVSPTATTTYTVTAADANGCTDISSVPVIVELCTGIHTTLNANHFITIFPTPFKDEITIRLYFPGNKNQADIKIYAVDGRMVKEVSIDALEVKITTSDMTQGIYFVKIITAKDVYFSKIIKK